MDAEKDCRWYLYDTTASLIFRKKTGFVDEGRDIHVLLDAFRGSVVNQHPDVHRRLVSEIMAATAAGNLNHPVATFTQIRNLPFITACVKESARLFPSIPVMIPRRLSQGGLVLKGLFIPEGTAIGARAVLLNRNPNVLLRPNAHGVLGILLHINRSTRVPTS